MALSHRLLSLAAGAHTALARRRLQAHDTGDAAQERTRRGLVAAMARTAQGRALGVRPGMAYDAFRRDVPLQSHDSVRPEIERMKRGEPDVLWPGRCATFASSAGAGGAVKHLPVTAEMRRHFARAGRESLLYYAARHGRGGLLGGRHLLLGGAAPPRPVAETGAVAGDLCSLSEAWLPDWYARGHHEPGREIAAVTPWDAKLDAVIERAWDRDIRLVAGTPAAVLQLAEQLKERIDSGGNGRLATLGKLWPRLECLVHGGAPITPYAEELHAALGPGVHFHEVYAAAEGFIAAQDADSYLGLRLMTGQGLFFEFLPAGDWEPGRLASLGGRAVPLREVVAGEDYALVLTTPGGLLRHVIGDIVRFLTVAPPRIVYAGRVDLALSAFGERVIEKELTDVATVVCQRHNWRLVNFHAAPLFASSVTGQRRGRHEWWLELRAGTAETPTGPLIGPELDAALLRLNERYAARRRSGVLDAPVVRLVIPGVFEHWMRAAGRWGGHHKMPRCRSDREVADELARLTRFTGETQSPFGR